MRADPLAEVDVMRDAALATVGAMADGSTVRADGDVRDSALARTTGRMRRAWAVDAMRRAWQVGPMRRDP